MFVYQQKPKDFDCGYNLDLMIASLPRIQNQQKRLEYAKRAVGLIKQSHPNWVDENGKSQTAWEHFVDMAEYDPEEYGIYNPFASEYDDDAQ